MDSFQKSVMVCLVIAGLMGCATVQPYQREALSQPCMASPLEASKPSRAYEDKVYQTLSGSMLPAGAPGGGCGCVN